MKPITISEQLMFNTIKLTAHDSSSGTGFFYHFNINDTIVPTIITNKHVVCNNSNETMTFRLHLSNGENSTEESIDITWTTYWYFHPTHDLCFCFVNPLFEEVKLKTNKKVFYKNNDESIIGLQEKLDELSAIEELVMVGYPIGLWDSVNNLPIFRKGFTASHPAMDFNGKNIGLIDMACFPGSSGSPIYILNENGYSDKKGNTYLGAKRIIFLGILYSGPTFNVEGKLIVKDIPTKQTPMFQTTLMANLGYYIKANEILSFKNEIIKILNL